MRLQSRSYRQVTSRTRCELFCCSGSGLTGSTGHVWLASPDYQALLSWVRPDWGVRLRLRSHGCKTPGELHEHGYGRQE